MFAQCLVFRLPTVELDGAGEALNVVERVLSWAVEEAGACELIRVTVSS